MRAQISNTQLIAKLKRIGGRIGASEQRFLEGGKDRQLRLGIKGRMIGGIVGGARETIECQDRSPMARCNDARRDGKILVVLRLAGLVLRIDRHCRPTSA